MNTRLGMFQEILEEPRPVALPSTAVVDTSSAELISTVGNTLIDAHFGEVRADFRQDMRQVEADAIAASEPTVELDPAATSPEVGEVAHQVALLRRSLDTGTQSEAGVRIRAERLLRQAINRHPGLAPEFRQITAETLGFDPTGNTMALALEAQKTRAEMYEEYRTTVVANARELGMDTAMLYGTDDEVANFFSEYNARMRQQDRLRALRVETEMNSGNTALVQQNTRQEMVTMINLALPQVVSEISGAMQSGGIDLTTAGASLFTQTTTEQRAGFRNLIQQRRAEMEMRFGQAALTAQITTTELEHILGPMNRVFDNYLAMLDPAANIADLTAMNSAITQFATHELLSRPGVAQAMAVRQLVDGLDPSTQQSILARTRYSFRVAALVNDASAAFFGNGNIPEIPSNDPEERAQAREAMLDQFRRGFTTYLERGEDESLTEEHEVAFYNAFDALTGEISRLGRQTPDDIQVALFEALADPRTAEFLERVDQDRTIRDRLTDVSIANYADHLLRNIQQDVNESFNSGVMAVDGRQREGSFGTRNIRTEADAVLFIDTANPEQLLFRIRQDAPLATGQGVQRRMSTINREYTRRLRSLVRAYATANEVSMQEAADVIVTDYFANFRISN